MIICVKLFQISTSGSEENVLKLFSILALVAISLIRLVLFMQFR